MLHIPADIHQARHNAIVLLLQQPTAIANHDQTPEHAPAKCKFNDMRCFNGIQHLIPFSAD